AYRSLLKSRRQEHHQRVAETIARDFPDVAEQQPELLAHHFAEAAAAAQAIPYLEKAGQRAVQRSANIDAISHYQRALELLAALPEGAGGEAGSAANRARKELALRLALGAPLMGVKGYANA